MEYSFLAARLSFTFDVHMCVFHLANKLCCCCCYYQLVNVMQASYPLVMDQPDEIQYSYIRRRQNEQGRSWIGGW